MSTKSKKHVGTVNRWEESSKVRCRQKADEILFEAYPYLSVYGLQQELAAMVDERKRIEDKRKWRIG